MTDVRTLRIAPADLVRLRIEADLVLGLIRAEAMRAEIAWAKGLGRPSPTREPNVSLLARRFEALRRDALVPA
ncbi:hypothetical protein [Streptomyces sp. NBC_01244]|uniref:hypothetical protein n=1 Tax=Streptomyces sp. NBC_01244 TaxID=2903797 RepID=UPI002E0F2041|nr:hypothetical protein OG247_32015 [Streptomyces sp. NBC_01244]